MLAAEGVTTRAEDYEALIETYNSKFGLDRPLVLQYLTYLSSAARFDFGNSITKYPARVSELVNQAMPWSIGLLVTSTLLAFVVGTLGGAVLAWQYGPKTAFELILPPFFLLAAVPYYLLGLILIWLLAFQAKLLPLGGGYAPTTLPDWSDFGFLFEVFKHSLLPALSIVLASIGFWALGMRSMMITMQGEDYMLQAEAKGLTKTRSFLRYGVRNAVLPQTTALALTLPHVVSGAILVERIFGYPWDRSSSLRSDNGFRLLCHSRRRVHHRIGHRFCDAGDRRHLSTVGSQDQLLFHVKTDGNECDDRTSSIAR